jgi:hypothetical protein
MSSRLVSNFTKSLTFVGLASVLASTFLAFGNPEPQNSMPSSEFRWLDEQNDAALWSKVEVAFSDELKPDKPDPDSLTYDYKHLERVGVTNNSALVIVGYRPTTASPDLEYFRAFSFNLVSGLRSSIINPERAGAVPLYMWKWEFSRLARFESSPVPDVVFYYLNCSECEPETILASLRFDSATRTWEIRSWGEGKPEWWITRVGLVIDLDLSVSATLSYNCLYGISDFNSDGLDELAIRCAELTEDELRTSHLADSTVLYSLKNGKLVGELLTASDIRTKILSSLCRNSPSNSLCDKGQPSR